MKTKQNFAKLRIIDGNRLFSTINQECVKNRKYWHGFKRVLKCPRRNRVSSNQIVFMYRVFYYPNKQTLKVETYVKKINKNCAVDPSRHLSFITYVFFDVMFPSSIGFGFKSSKEKWPLSGEKTSILITCQILFRRISTHRNE